MSPRAPLKPLLTLGQRKFSSLIFVQKLDFDGNFEFLRQNCKTIFFYPKMYEKYEFFMPKLLDLMGKKI